MSLSPGHHWGNSTERGHIKDGNSGIHSSAANCQRHLAIALHCLSSKDPLGWCILHSFILYFGGGGGGAVPWLVCKNKKNDYSFPLVIRIFILLIASLVFETWSALTTCFVKKWITHVKYLPCSQTSQHCSNNFTSKLR